MTTTTTNHITATDAVSLVREAFPFEVQRLPLTGPDNMPTPHKGLFRDDTGKCVGSAVTGRYRPHTTAHVEQLVEASVHALGGTVGSITTRWDQGHRVIIKPTDDERREICDNDGVFPMLFIRAGFDGTAVKFNLGMFRDVCRNLAMIRAVDGMSLSANIRHTQSIGWKMDELVERVRGLTAKADTMVDAMRAANEREVSLAEFIRTVYPIKDDASDRTVNSFLRRAESITRRVWNERSSVNRDRQWGTGIVTAWEAFNAVQGYEQHDATRRGLSDRGNMSRAVAALEVPAVARAEELAFA